MTCHCGNPVKAKGLCQKHYLADYRARKNRGELWKRPLTYTVRTDKTRCAVVDCFDKHRALGLCTKHYFQVRRQEAKLSCCPYCESKCANCGDNSYNGKHLCDDCQATSRRIER